MASGPPAQALATHLINQTLASISLLETLSLVSSADASLIRSKLPNPYGPFPTLTNAAASSSNPSTGAAPPADLSTSFGGLYVGSGSPPNQNQNPPHQSFQPSIQPGAPAPSLPPRNTPHGPETRGRALWDYSGTEADDLRFRAGDTIIIDEEVNAQWSRGRVIPDGQQMPLEKSGLFPSNYVEKTIPPPNSYFSPPPPPSAMVPYQNNYYQDNKQSYGMPPPGQGQGQMMMMAPPPQQAPIVVHEEKKNRFGKIGSNLGNAAVTGAGFGFGSAVASDLVNKIF